MNQASPGPAAIWRDRAEAVDWDGWSAAPVRHGVSVIRSGHRYTLGLVFHDAA